MTDFIENTADQTADSTFTDEKIENETPDTVTFEDFYPSPAKGDSHSV